MPKQSAAANAASMPKGRPKGTVAIEAIREACAARARTYDLNDAISDMWHLYHVLDALVEVVGEPGGGESERAGAFAWVARDLAENCAKGLEGNFGKISPAMEVGSHV
jgi:hypothetical protein